MGYARLEQKGAGIHLRQFARSFVFDDGASRVLFVSVDVAMVSVAIRKEVFNFLSLLIYFCLVEFHLKVSLERFNPVQVFFNFNGVSFVL
jgi:Neutral/alkaline non-lysosomal ceramidase, N-terminal